MKRGMSIGILIVFFLATFILPLGIVSAACAPEDIILKLYSQTNAHAEKWDGIGNYPVEICYSNIFGSAYTGANPHTCSPPGNPTNKVLRLSGSTQTNSHAEGPLQSTPGYSNLCYGDLSCALELGSCISPRRPVVRLSSQLNAHLENASLSNYNYIVCCSTGGGPGPGPAQCSDGIDNDADTLIDTNDPGCHTDGNAANSATYDPNDDDEANVLPGTPTAFWATTSAPGNPAANNLMLFIGQDIVLVAKGAALGASVTFNIYDSDSAESGADDLIKTLTVTANGLGTATSAPIHFNLIEFAIGNDIVLDNSILELYFTATAPSYSEQSTNTILLNNSTPPPTPIDKKGCAQFETTNNCNQATTPDISKWIAAWHHDESILYPPANQIKGVGCGGTTNLGEYINCSCFWDSDNACKFRWSYNNSLNPNPPGIIEQCIYGCNFGADYGECLNDIVDITYYATYGLATTSLCIPSDAFNATEETECMARDGAIEQIMCGLAPSLMLPFFSKEQFLITALALVAIYTLIIFKRRN